MYFMLEKWLPVHRALCPSTLQRFNLNHNLQFSKSSMRKLLRVRPGERQRERHSPPAGTLLFLQGNYVRVRRGGWTSPSLLPLTVGKWDFMQISQHFGSDQESLTSMQATNPAGRRQPGAGNNSHSHTDVTEPHTPLNRMGDGKAPENRDGPFSPGLCQAPHLRWLQVKGGHLTF